MSSLLRSVKKRKKSRVLGEVEVLSREEYSGLELDSKVEMIRALIPLGLMHVEELLDEEVKALAGERYARKEATLRGRRHGSNPGTVGLGGQRVPVRVPRVRSVAGGEIPLRSYEELSPDGAVNELLLRRVLYGISCRNYESAAEAISGAIGLSSSTVSRGFVQASGAKLREMQERDLSAEDVVAIFLDGKMFADATMVVALGITITGDKRFLGFVETSTENEQVLTPFLRSLMERGLDISEGVLVIVDGGKGLRAAVKRAFGNRARVQRCQWHKRENVVSYLSKTEQAAWRRRLQRAYERPEYNQARAALDKLHGELEERNQSAAASLEEGLEETLTLHRLGRCQQVISRGRCNTSHKKRGEVYGQETKEQADEEAAMVHSDRAGRGVGSLAAGRVVPIDRTRAGQRGIGDSSSTGPVRGHPSAVPLPVIAGTDSGRT